jgi:pimeloyl-ACP methyl ester carboxylesterase
MTMVTPQTGYAPVNGLNMYYEIHGDGAPLVLLHGGLGSTGMFGEVLEQLAQHRQVIAADLQAHGRTADIDRPIRLELMGDDVAALIAHLGLDKADVMGYSMGGGAALATAIRHPALVRKLVLVSVPFRRNGWYPEILAAMGQMSAAAAEFMRNTPMYQGYAAVAPHPDHFPTLLDKMGDLLRQEYDWAREVSALPMPTMLVFGDADSVPPAHAVEFFELLGGGKRDAGWDGAGMSTARLAILPGTTHYNSFSSPALAGTVIPFLDTPVRS